MIGGFLTRSLNDDRLRHESETDASAGINKTVAPPAVIYQRQWTWIINFFTLFMIIIYFI